MHKGAARSMHTQDDSRTVAAVEPIPAAEPSAADAPAEDSVSSDSRPVAAPSSDPSLSDPDRFAREELQLEQQVQREVDEESDGMHDGTNPLEDALNEKDDDDDDEDQAAAQQEEEEAQQMAAREAADEVADANEESASPEPSPLSESTESSPASAVASALSASPSTPATTPSRFRPRRYEFAYPRDASLVLTLVRARNYAGAIEHFRALWAHWIPQRRGGVPGLTTLVLERYLHALSTLHQYEDVLALYKADGMDQPLRKMWMRSPLALDTLLQACIRHPKDAPVHELCLLLSKMDIYRDREHQQSVAALTASVPSMPAPVLTLLLSEKVVNQLIKAALLRNDAVLAMDICYHFVMGYRVGRFSGGGNTASADKTQPLYATRNYRLHSQAAHGLIMYLLHSQRYSQDAPPAPPTLRLAPALSYPDAAHHTSLFRAFRVYLQTRFIENLLDNELLFRILRTVLSAVLNPPRWPSNTPSFKRMAAQQLRLKNAWLAFQIYGYILRHNESIRRADASHDKAHSSATADRRMFDPTSSGSGTSSAPRSNAKLESERGTKDTPWSCANHRRFIPLQWEAHHRPLIQICLLRLDGLGATPSADALTGEAEVKFDPAVLLDQLLYDVRMTHQDYSVLLEELHINKEERDEIDALELNEASQDEELAQYSTALSRERTAGDALSLLPALPPMTLLPNLPLRPVDAPLFLQLVRRHLRDAQVVGVLMVYQSIPALKRFDALRTEIVELTLAHLATTFSNAPARHLVNNTRAMLAHMQTIAQAWRDPAAVQARRNGAAATQSATDARGNVLGFELQPLSLNQLLVQHQPQNNTLYAMHLHSTCIAENASAGLSFLLRVFGRLDEFGTCFHFFQQEVWRVPPTRTEFEMLIDLMTRAQHMPGGTHVVRALQLTLMLQSSSLRPLSTLLLVFKAYTNLTGLPHAWFLKGSRHKLHASCDEPDVGRQVGENLAQLFAHILRMHIQPLMQKASDPASSAAEFPPQVPQLLHYLQSYLAWRTQHRVPRRTAADLLPEETYLRLAQRYPTVPGVVHSVLCPPLNAGDAPSSIPFTSVPASGVLVVQPAGQWALLSPALRTEWCALVPSIADAMENARNVKQLKEQEAVAAAAATATGVASAASRSASSPSSSPARPASAPRAARPLLSTPAAPEVDLGVVALDSIRASFRSRRVTPSAQAQAALPKRRSSSLPAARSASVPSSPSVASSSAPPSKPRSPKSTGSSPKKQQPLTAPVSSAASASSASLRRVAAALDANSPSSPSASIVRARSKPAATNAQASPDTKKLPPSRKTEKADSNASADHGQRRSAGKTAASTTAAAHAPARPARSQSLVHRVVSKAAETTAKGRSRSVDAAPKTHASAALTADVRLKTATRTPRARTVRAAAASTSASASTKDTGGA